MDVPGEARFVLVQLEDDIEVARILQLPIVDLTQRAARLLLRCQGSE